MNNCTSQHFILGNDYLNIYGIDLNDDKERYVTIGGNNRQKFAFPLNRREITVIRKVQSVNTEKLEKDQFIEAQSHEVAIINNVERPYPSLLRRKAYPASSEAREEWETNGNELMKLVALRNIGHNEEVEVTIPVIITWHNHKSRMVGDLRALNTYTITDRYAIPIIHETLTQLSKESSITSMDSLKGFHHNFFETSC
ncbi:hypothetical protein O181_015612 [Austropuccinia psidii MF-1]|uniref:Uncharacterized protein n=1 Tax=Austropuccinia psidii MF-1 TaxID=1389203 RepID=A0A9Q3C2F5_9BASI|nr:hypothetical protein [Austropuccinia psidii MF-1]